MVTRSDTTVAAVRAAIRVLRPGGVLTVVGYTGHEGGWEEVEAVMSVVSELDPRQFTAGALVSRLPRPFTRSSALRKRRFK